MCKFNLQMIWQKKKSVCIETEQRGQDVNIIPFFQISVSFTF